MTRWIDRPPRWSLTIPATRPVSEPFLGWLVGTQPVSAPIALPADWTGVVLAAAGRGWATRCRRRDELERYLQQATLDDAPLTQLEHRRLRAVLSAPPAPRAAGGWSVEAVTAVFAGCLPAAPGGRSAGQSATAAMALTRHFLEFALAQLDPGAFATVASMRLERVGSGHPRSGDVALVLTQTDLIARCWLVGALAPEQFEPAAGVVRAAAQWFAGPTNRAEVVLYLRQLIQDLDVDPLRGAPGQDHLRSELPHLRRAARVAGGADDDGRRFDVDEIVDRSDLLVLLGAPGMGLSWLARRAARRSAEDALNALAFGADVDEVQLPVFATGSQLAGLNAGDRTATAIAAGVAAFAASSAADRAAELRVLLARSGARRLLVVDGIDEMRGGTLAYPVGSGRRTIVTCRPRGWRAQLPVDPRAIGQGFAEILPLQDAREVDAFIDHWFRRQPERGHRLARLIGTRIDLRGPSLSVLSLAVLCLTDPPPEDSAGPQDVPSPPFRQVLLDLIGDPPAGPPQALMPRSLRDHRAARGWATRPLSAIVDRLTKRPDADPIWEQAAEIVVAHPERRQLLGRLLEVLDGRDRSPYQPAGPQERMLVDIAAETTARDWPELLAERIQRARVARAAGRDFTDLMASLHWTGSNPQAADVLVGRLEREWTVPECERIAIAVAALEPSAAQAARAIAALAGRLHETRRVADAALLADALVALATTDDSHRASWHALERLLVRGQAWAQVIAEAGLIRLATPAQGWDRAARRLVALPRDRTARWEARVLVEALVARARTAPDRAKLAASLFVLLIGVPAGAAPAIVAALLALAPPGDDTRGLRNRLLQRITNADPLSDVDAEAWVDALVLLEPDDGERAVARNALLTALCLAGPGLVSRDLGAGLFTRYLDLLGATEPERDIARSVVLTALEGVTAEGVEAARRGFRTGPWTSRGRIRGLVEALHDLDVGPGDRRRAQTAIAELIDRGALAHPLERADWTGALQRLGAPAADELPDSPPRGASRPPITQPVPILSPEPGPQPSVSMALPQASPASPPPVVPRFITEPVPVGTPIPGPQPPGPPGPPGPPPGVPDRHPVPAAAVIGRPPPPLPGTVAMGPPPVEHWAGDYQDSVLAGGLGELETWPQRLHAVARPGWSVVSVLRATAPARGSQLPDGRYAILDEAGLQVAVMRLPAQALDPLPGVPLLSRLRVLHARLLPGVRPSAARWSQIGGTPAVLDTLAGGAAFQLSAELTADDGLLAFGAAPPSRARTLQEVGVPLAALARPGERGLIWATPPHWWRVEEVQLHGTDASATVTLEPLPAGADLASWTELLFRRAPFLRDFRSVDERAVRISGCEEARLHRFDWQPSGRSRLLSTLVAGIAGGHGVSVVVEVPLDSEQAFTVDPDRLLSWIALDP